MAVDVTSPIMLVRPSVQVAYAGIPNRVIADIVEVQVSNQVGFAGVPVYVDPVTMVVEVSLDALVGTFAPKPDGDHYLYANVGVSLPKWKDGGQYLFSNVGVSLPKWKDGGQYLYSEITDDDPFPHLWWLNPEAGETGDSVALVGNGFGATQAIHSGQVYLNDQLCTVVSWALVAATGGSPFIDEGGKSTNVEHVLVIVTVPLDGESGNMFVETEIEE